MKSKKRMLKTTKYILTGVGVSAAGTGIYFVVNHYFLQPQKSNRVSGKQTTKYYDTVPGPDSSLDRLNKILRDNKEVSNDIQPVSPISVEVYENIDKNSRLYDSLVEAGYIQRVEDENLTHHNQKFENGQDIRGDKFLAKKSMSILGQESPSSDSLAGSLAGIRPVGSKMSIEFWESPVNYKGYRLGRDKMIVFGVMPDEVKIVKYNGELYLVTINNIFEVSPCTDFCQLRPIKDKTLLANIMQNAH